MNKKVLVLLPLYSGKNAIKKIQSVLSQTYANLDLLIVCDKTMNEETLNEIKTYRDDYYKWQLATNRPKLIIFEGKTSRNPINEAADAISGKLSTTFDYIAILSESYLDKIALEQSVYQLENVECVKAASRIAVPKKKNMVWHVQHLEAENNFNKSINFVFRTDSFIKIYRERGYIFSEVADHDYDLSVYITTKRMRTITDDMIKAYIEPEETFKDYWAAKVRNFTSSLQTFKNFKTKETIGRSIWHFTFLGLFGSIITTAILLDGKLLATVGTALISLILITVELTTSRGITRKTKLLSLTLIPTSIYLFSTITSLLASYMLHLAKVDSKWLFKNKIDMFRVRGVKSL